jgi:hypothetical protein
MPTASQAPILPFVGFAFALTLGLSAFAQDTNNLDSVSQETTQWIPKERMVPKGETTLALPHGAPIPAFAAGGTKEAAFDAFMEDQMVAGFIVVHDGTIRMERYARGHSATNCHLAVGR